MAIRTKSLLKNSIALILYSGSLIASQQALANNCELTSTTGNWDNASMWLSCGSGIPLAGDSVAIADNRNAMLNGVSTPVLADVVLGVTSYGDAQLTDQGSAAGHLSAANFKVAGNTTNQIDFRSNNSNLTLSVDFLVGENVFGSFRSGKAYFGSGIVRIGGGLYVRPDDTNFGGGIFEMITGGTLEFTGSSATIESKSSSSAAITKLKGPNSSSPLNLKAAGAANFTGGGTFELDYVHFATGTWTSNATGTFTITNCTKAAGVTVPIAWGCTQTGGVVSPIPASIDLISHEKPMIFTEEIDMQK